MERRYRRRGFLGAVGTVGILGGCVSSTPDPSSTPTPACSKAEIESVRRTIEDEFPYDEHLIVEVAVQSDEAPPLKGEIATCDGTVAVNRDLSTEQTEYEFGPYGHHCIHDREFWIDGCRSE